MWRANSQRSPLSFYRPDIEKFNELNRRLVSLSDAPPTDVVQLLSVLIGEAIPPRSSLATSTARFVQRQVSRAPSWSLKKFLSALAAEALAFSRRFSDGTDAATLQLNPVLVAWSKEQCLSILSCAYLCLFPRDSSNCRSTNSGDLDLPSINFDEMYFQSAESVETEKMLMFYDYFNEMLKRSGYCFVSNTERDPAAQEAPSSPGSIAEPVASAPCITEGVPRVLTLPIRIMRCSCTQADLTVLLDRMAEKPLSRCVIRDLMDSIDHESSMLRVDFANMMIGGASLAYGCVQEEISFSICPELNTARLVHGPMRDHEAIVIAGAEQFSLLQPGTYAHGMKYGGKVPVPTPRGGAVLAIDAVDYRYAHPSTQYQWRSIARELAKCVAAFSAPYISTLNIPAEEAMNVATGNWGCGVFGGDVELKFLIQWLACTLADKTMHYFPFNLQKFHTYFKSRLLPLCEARLTVARLTQFLYTEVRQIVSMRQGVWQGLEQYLLRAPTEPPQPPSAVDVRKDGNSAL